MVLCQGPSDCDGDVLDSLHCGSLFEKTPSETPSYAGIEPAVAGLIKRIASKNKSYLSDMALSTVFPAFALFLLHPAAPLFSPVFISAPQQPQSLFVCSSFAWQVLLTHLSALLLYWRRPDVTLRANKWLADRARGAGKGRNADADGGQEGKNQNGAASH